MATEFKLPELGEGVKSGTIANVLVSTGDEVSANSAIIEIETDKAVAEIPIPFAGKITGINVKSGDTVKVGQTILLIEKSDGEASGEAEPKKKQEPEAEAAQAEAEPEPESEKTKAEPAKAEKKAPREPAPAARRSGGAVLASPSVRKLARELGVRLEDVRTADPSGRVTAQDVEDHASSGGADSGSSSSSDSDSDSDEEYGSRDESKAGRKGDPASPVPVRSGPLAVAGPVSDDRWGKVVREAMSGVRKKTVEHMTHCWTTIPHVTHFETADITALEQVRKEYAPGIKAEGGSLTVTVFIMKVITEALRRFPKFNASIDLETEEIILKQYYHIGVAVDTPAGLLVPAIRNVDRKTLQDLAMELPAIAKKSRDRKLTLEDMSGTTFTISNLGGLGGTGFTPIINSPEVAILGVSRASVEGVFQNGQLVPRTMLPLSLSYDHRLIDGADAARFLRWVAEALENPWKLILEA